MRITIVGAGNVGTQIAVHCAEKGHNVCVFGSKPEKISKELFIIDDNNRIIHKGKINKSTNNEEEAFKNAELVFVTMPAFLMDENAKKIEKYVTEKTKICLVPGTGGGEFAFNKCIEKGAIIFGIQRVPSVARLIEYGKIVKAVGYRNEMHVSAIPNVYTQECANLIENIFDIKTNCLSNYLNITLTPSNPILHTTRLRVLYKDWFDGYFYDKVPLFYEEWNDESSLLLFQCDDEVQKICNELNMFDLSNVKSLKIHYESPTIEKMTEKIRNIKGFKGIESPKIEIEGKGFIPDFESRYFTADFDYGLSILVEIADLLNIKVPKMVETLNWYRNIKKNTSFSLIKYRINNIEDFISFYSR